MAGESLNSALLQVIQTSVSSARYTLGGPAALQWASWRGRLGRSSARPSCACPCRGFRGACYALAAYVIPQRAPNAYVCTTWQPTSTSQAFWGEGVLALQTGNNPAARYEKPRVSPMNGRLAREERILRCDANFSRCASYVMRPGRRQHCGRAPRQ